MYHWDKLYWMILRSIFLLLKLVRIMMYKIILVLMKSRHQLMLNLSHLVLLMEQLLVTHLLNLYHLKNFKSMKTSYTRMFYDVNKILKGKLDVNDIKEFLSYYSVTFRKKVEQCSDISSILHHVKDECSLTDIELLHSIVEEIAEAKEYIETYRAELKEFYKSISVSLCLEENLALFL
ncbi:PREDICTED: uncharacterized protein LOC109587662 [Amphimedon queenslandica]|uniref:Uncharacterized protein n=1 Tax=Amphimedon queenslandica TaxID=400682 RepID=A0AAN0JRH1_AMPQE|nr:PREDICTED: uncharacterized protein LOC109587662 [Amphimedon queenslandica]|eukprot:XP_019859444.1 PREDICTED: uncharacterized protein LOC109587662 [Amphimedon queenslandica]